MLERVLLTLNHRSSAKERKESPRSMFAYKILLYHINTKLGHRLRCPGETAAPSEVTRRSS